MILCQGTVTNPDHKSDKILLKMNEAFHWEGSFTVQESLLIFSLLLLSSVDNHFLLKKLNLQTTKLQFLCFH